MAANKKIERRKSTQLELPGIELEAKTAKPALWRIDSKVLRGKLMKEFSMPSLDLPTTDKVANREWCLSPLVEDSEDKSHSQVEVDDDDRNLSKSNLHRDSKDDISGTEGQFKQEDSGSALQQKPLPSDNDNNSNVELDVEMSPSTLKSDSHDDSSSSNLKTHSNDNKNHHRKLVKSYSSIENKNPPQLKLRSFYNTNHSRLEKEESFYDRSCHRILMKSLSTIDSKSPPQLKTDSNDPSQLVEEHSNDDRGPPQLKTDSNDDRAPDSENEKSSSQLIPHRRDDRSPQQSNLPTLNESSPSQLLKPHSHDDRSPSQLLKPHSRNDRSPSQSSTANFHDDWGPSQLKPRGADNNNLNSSHLLFHLRSHSSIDGQVCPLTPIPDDRAISCGIPDVRPTTLTKTKSSESKLSRDPSYYQDDNEPYSPSVLPPLKSPLLPRISNRNITSSPCGGKWRGSSLHRYDTLRSLQAQRRRHRNSDSICSLPDFQSERKHGGAGVLERRMTRQKTGLTLGQSIELLTTPDASSGFNSAMSSDGESVASTGSNFSIIESQSRRLHRQKALSPGTSLSRSSSRRVFSPNPFSRSLSRASLNRSFTRRQLMQMQESKRRFSKEELMAKFRYALRMIRFMVRLELSLKHYSRNVDQQQTIEQLNYYSREAAFSSEKLVFNKTNFAATNVVHMPPWARRMLALPPSERNSKDIHHLATMLKAMKFFKDGIQMDRICDLCRHCSYHRYEKQRVLIRTGHLSQFTYLLFSGSVFVNIEENDSENGKKYYRTAAVLGKGTVFGEIAVIHKVPRTANIIARENIEVLVVDPPTCFRIFPEEINREYNLTLENMRFTELFKDWPEKALNDLCLVSKRNQYPFGAIIEKNTKDSEFIYLVAKGRVELVCDVPLSRVNTSLLDRSSIPVQLPEHNLAKFMDHPPDHAYLPPIPNHTPKLMCQEALGRAIKKGSALVSVDSLLPYQVCDLVSLLKTRGANTLMLISRGSEVIRIPKLRLQTIPPRKYWKDILEIAKNTAKYPGYAVLTRLFVEHHQWTAYKKIVLQDTLKTIPGFTPKQKKSTAAVKKDRKGEKISQTVVPEIVLSLVDDDGHGYDNCLSNNEPIHDMKSHHHEGRCLRTWQGECESKKSPLTLGQLRSKRRALSLT